MPESRRISIAVITYNRPALLAALLASLQSQEVSEGDEIRIVVVDNAADGSARPVVERCRGRFPIDYVIEPEPGIPFARQRSVEFCAGADALVFVDDDEVAPPGWLERLLSTWRETDADVVTGPVRGLLPPEAPGWARVSDVYDSRGRHQTGDRISRAYTNNTLVSQTVLDRVTPAFHPAFRYTGSSDLHFFLRVAAAGFVIIWDDEAVIEEVIPPERARLSWLVRRAFRSGAGDTISRRLIHPGGRGWATSLLLGLARLLHGGFLLVIGVGHRRSRIKGLRRCISGFGSLAGLAGINHAEYRR